MGLTPELDARITQMLREKSRLTQYMIPGLDEVDAADALAAYAAAHAAEGVAFAGGVLSSSQTPAPSPTLFPVPAEHAAAQPGYVAAPPVRTVSGWLWLLPIMFGFIGGIVAWAVAKDKDPERARQFVVAGALIGVLTACIGGYAGARTVSRLGRAGATDTAWPASQSGRPAFYYFGSAG